jgi:hypothetical protein
MLRRRVLDDTIPRQVFSKDTRIEIETTPPRAPEGQ